MILHIAERGPSKKSFCGIELARIASIEDETWIRLDDANEIETNPGRCLKCWERYRVCDEASEIPSNEEPKQNRCADCNYFKRVDMIPGFGDCRRFPPQRFDSNPSGFPEVAASDWCGEWREK